MKTYTTIDRCRACGCTELREVLSLGNQVVSDFPTTAELDIGVRCPIELVACPRCTLVQQRHTAPQELLYSRHYWYKSGTTDTMRAALKEVADACMSRVSARDDPESFMVLDIGSNDGTLLRAFPEWAMAIGVEPADNLATSANYHDQGVSLFHDFWPLRDGWNLPKAKIITAIGMMYDLDDPNPFIKAVADALHPDGIFCAQLMCLQNMLAVSDLGNLCHEHLEFYTLQSLSYLYGKHGLVITDVETNDVNGQSYRIWARKDKRTSPEEWASMSDGMVRVTKALQAEDDIMARLDRFHDRMLANRERVVRAVKDARLRGDKVWVYGASTKGNVILQWYGLDNSLIHAAADRDPGKWGRWTAGSRIPITSEEEFRKANPKYALVLPYAFLKEFLQREMTWLKGGGRFLVPLPEFKLI